MSEKFPTNNEDNNQEKKHLENSYNLPSYDRKNQESINNINHETLLDDTITFIRDKNWRINNPNDISTIINTKTLAQQTIQEDDLLNKGYNIIEFFITLTSEYMESILSGLDINTNKSEIRQRFIFIIVQFKLFFMSQFF